MTKNIIDKGAYEINVDDKEFAAFSGQPFQIDGIGRYKSVWHFFTEPTEHNCMGGELIRKGDVTLINPDQESPIAFMSLQMDESLHFNANGVEVVSSKLKVSAFPRLDGALDDKGEGVFRKLMDRKAPNASYHVETPAYGYPPNPVCGHHMDFVKERLGECATAGLPLIRLNKGKSQTMQIEDLKDDVVISKYPSVREAFVKVISTFAEPKGAANMFKQQEAKVAIPSAADIVNAKRVR